MKRLRFQSQDRKRGSLCEISGDILGRFLLTFAPGVATPVLQPPRGRVQRDRMPFKQMRVSFLHVNSFLEILCCVPDPTPGTESINTVGVAPAFPPPSRGPSAVWAPRPDGPPAGGTGQGRTSRSAERGRRWVGQIKLCDCHQDPADKTGTQGAQSTAWPLSPPPGSHTHEFGERLCISLGLF